MDNIHQLFAGVRDHAPSLQLLKVSQHCKNIQQYVIRMSAAFQLTFFWESEG